MTCPGIQSGTGSLEHQGKWWPPPVFLSITVERMLRVGWVELTQQVWGKLSTPESVFTGEEVAAIGTLISRSKNVTGFTFTNFTRPLSVGFATVEMQDSVSQRRNISNRTFQGYFLYIVFIKFSNSSMVNTENYKTVRKEHKNYNLKYFLSKFIKTAWRSINVL